ncbi:maleylpyruvate isomerase N-terminal domain-containing protein [Streptomyces sp. NPDC057499]|uniref:maleylpyruvate isomerase N-terminal domain-containing protein n=1 Tax=Streptomyces sp. NPDC057499 TaxID=3346150 RepID=UPI00367CD837
MLDLREGHRAFAALLASVWEADWTAPSAAPGWTVRDQVAHLADAEEGAASSRSTGR